MAERSYLFDRRMIHLSVSNVLSRAACLRIDSAALEDESKLKEHRHESPRVN
jgi:hypothetical protein